MLAFPESVDVGGWGRPTFRAAKKDFGVFAGDPDHDFSLIVRPDADDRPALLEDGRFYVPPHFGPGGWLALELSAAGVDWEEVTELHGASYRQAALNRMLKALDAPGDPALLVEGQVERLSPEST